jgi:hypothetical protein
MAFDGLVHGSFEFEEGVQGVVRDWMDKSASGRGKASTDRRPSNKQALGFGDIEKKFPTGNSAAH